MAREMPKVARAELNYTTKCVINTTPEAETPTYSDMTVAFKNIGVALNEQVYTASYLADEGYSSSMVTGLAPTVTLTGDFMADDPVCAYLDKKQWGRGADRVTDIKMTRNGQTIASSVTLTGIAIAGGESTAPNTVTVTIAFNGKPTITEEAAGANLLKEDY